MNITGLALLIDVVVVGGLLAVFLSANKLVGARSVHEGDGLLPYETGMPPLERAVDNMAVLYYRFAVLFVVFDVDLAFVLPWALNRQMLDLRQVLAVTGFIGLMFLMLIYFWRKGVLECR